jgi:hypothetical protein
MDHVVVSANGQRRDLAHFAVARQTELTIVGVAATAATFAATLTVMHIWSSHTSGVAAAELGIKISAGVAAAFAAMIALGRFELARIAEARTRDADRSALYVSAVEQLGSDKAIGRFAGLYSLERLARDDANFRPVVMAVWCAYLRTPTVEGYGEETTAADSAEIEVRRLAQSLILRHRQYMPWNEHLDQSLYWDEPLDVDLSGAALVDFGDNNMRWPEFVSFRRARFYGRTFIDGSHGTGFEGGVSFDEATFVEDATFQGEFKQRTGFRGTTFEGQANFQHAHFEMVDFQAASFKGATWFAGGCSFFGRDFPERREHAFEGARYFAELHWPDFHDRVGDKDGSLFPDPPD